MSAFEPPIPVGAKSSSASYINFNDRAEIDSLLAKIEGVQGDVATAATRDVLLAEATFGEIKKSPQSAFRLADRTFEQIEWGRWHTVRRALAAHAIDGLSSPTLKAKVSARMRQWFPRWHSYSLADTFQVMADWPDDPGLRPALWRGLHDEYFEVAQAAARTIGRHFAGQSDVGDALYKLIASPPSVATAAAAIGALWCGWPQHPKLSAMLDEASKSDSDLIAIAGKEAAPKHGLSLGRCYAATCLRRGRRCLAINRLQKALPRA